MDELKKQQAKMSEEELSDVNGGVVFFGMAKKKQNNYMGESKKKRGGKSRAKTSIMPYIADDEMDGGLNSTTPTNRNFLC